MNICLRTALCMAALLALAGCASGGGVASYPAEPDITSEGGRLAVDDDYVAAIERYALRSGAVVQWVNPPQKRIVASLDP